MAAIFLAEEQYFLAVMKMGQMTDIFPSEWLQFLVLMSSDWKLRVDEDGSDG